MTSWVILFVTQITLIARRRTRLHQRLGILGGVLAGLIVVIGTLTSIASSARGVPTEADALKFLAIPLGDMLVFAILVGTALYFRRRLETHKRLMLLASFSLLSAAVARFPFEFIETGSPLVFLGLTDLLIVAFVAVDTFKNRRLHPAFLGGVLFMIGVQLSRALLAETDLWMRFAGFLVGFAR
jgi:hypothetical protein